MQNSIDTLDFVQLSVTFERKLVRTVSCKAANSDRCGPFSRRLSPLSHSVALCGFAPTTPPRPSFLALLQATGDAIIAAQALQHGTEKAAAAPAASGS